LSAWSSPRRAGKRLAPGAIGPELRRRLDPGFHRGEAWPRAPFVLDRREPGGDALATGAHVAAAGLSAPAGRIGAETPQRDPVRAEAQGALPLQAAFRCGARFHSSPFLLAGMTVRLAGLDPRGLRGMARRETQTYGVRIRCRTRRAPRGAPHTLSVRYRASRCLSAMRGRAPSACDLRRLRRRARFDCRAQGGRSPTAREHISASSWQGLLVVPGGAPLPPGCFGAREKPAGAAPRPAVTTPRENAPSSGRGEADDTAGPRAGDNRRRHPGESRGPVFVCAFGALDSGLRRNDGEGDTREARFLPPPCGEVRHACGVLGGGKSSLALSSGRRHSTPPVARIALK